MYMYTEEQLASMKKVEATRKERYENLFGETRFWTADPDNFAGNQRYYSLNYYCGHMQTGQTELPDAYSIRCILAE